MLERPTPATDTSKDVNVLKVLPGIGLALTVLGVALIPLPGPGFMVLSLGVVVTAVAVALLQQRSKRT